MEKDFPFIFQKISNHGTKNPIVSRLTVQSFELMRMYLIDKKVSDYIATIMIEMV